MKGMTILGARPQFIKSACMSLELKQRGVQEVMIHTGQHFDASMSQIFFEQMNLKRADYFLDIHSLSHGAMTGRMMEEIEKILLLERPDFTVVYGDTNSTLAGALASCKLHIPVVHIEAGLRSFDMKMPEEINRILTDRISSLLLVPSQAAQENLAREGFESFDSQITWIGDVMLDSLLHFRPFSTPPKGIPKENFILCTLHRQENSDNKERLMEIIGAIEEAGELMPVVLPLHPRTRARLEHEGLKLDESKVLVIDPVGYLEMLWLLEHCKVVMTDSGGVQKEAYCFGKLCLTLRDSTEWVELMTRGANFLVGSNKETILGALHQHLEDSIIPDLDIYGGGKASQRALDALLNFFKETP